MSHCSRQVGVKFYMHILSFKSLKTHGISPTYHFDQSVIILRVVGWFLYSNFNDIL